MAFNQTYGDEGAAAVVLDVGSNCTKAGFAGEDTPQHVFSTAVGTFDEAGAKQFAVNRREGWHSRHRGGQPFEVDYPVVQGLVVDWDCLERVWDHIFTHELRIDPQQHPVLIVEQSFSPRDQREKMAEIMFDKHGTTGLFLGKSALLCCVAASKTTGLVLESGGGISTAVPVQDGVVITGAIQKSALAGDVLTDELARRFESVPDSCRVAHQFCRLGNGKFESIASTSSPQEYYRYMRRCSFQSVKENLCQLSEWTLPPGTQARAHTRNRMAHLSILCLRRCRG